MSETLVLAKMKLRPENVAQLDHNQATTANNLKRVKGFVGRSSWKDAADPLVHLTAYEYSDAASAAEGLKVVVEGPILVASSKLLLEPPEVLQVVVVTAEGVRVHEARIGSVMSISARVADPGQSADLDRDLETIFGELRSINGFLGSIRGYKVALEEEIVGIALWTNLASFERSMPANPTHEVRSYKRIF